MSENNLYYLRWMGRVSGPFAVEDIRAQLARGKVSRHHQVSRDGQQWVALQDSDVLPPKIALVQRFPQEEPAPLPLRVETVESASDENPPPGMIPRRFQGYDEAPDAYAVVSDLLRDGGGGWMTFIGILAVILGGFACLSSLFFLITLIVSMNSGSADAIAGQAIVSISSTPAVLLLIAGIRMVSAASNMRIGILGRTMAPLREGLNQARSAVAAFGWFFAIQLFVLLVSLLIIFFVAGLSLAALTDLS
jgi:hypothetical protein